MTNKTDTLKFTVTVDPNKPSTAIYRIDDGKQPDQLNTLKANSHLQAIDKINRRYINQFHKLNFRLKQTQAKATWPNNEKLYTDTQALQHRRKHQRAESYWLNRIKQHQKRFQKLNQPPGKKLTALAQMTLDTTINETLITFEDPPDIDIEDGQ